MKRIEAYAYLRVSGKGQLNQTGFNRQLDTINRFCQNSPYETVKVYREQISGTTGESQRPEMGLMIADIFCTDCNTIIVEDLTRLAREYRIQENILIYLASRQIDLITANTGENITEAIASDPMRKALVQMQGVFGELDKSLLVLKLRKARQHVKSLKGRCEGAKPYGAIDGEDEVVKLIKRLRRKPRNSSRKRLSCQQIANRLNRKGIKPRRSERWSASLVYNVLKPHSERNKK